MIISRLVLENILSHKRTELVFDSGLNVIVGESGYGKTAVARVLNWMLVGDERPEGLVSQASRRCRAELTTADSVRLIREWDGRNEVCKVAVPGKKMRSFKVGHPRIPQEVRKYAISTSELGPGLKVCLQLPPTTDGLFLINQPPEVRARALGSLQGVLAADAALNDVGAADYNPRCFPARGEADFKTEVHRLIKQSIVNARQKAIQELEVFVTSALSTTFMGDLRFEIKYTPENGAEFVIISPSGDGKVVAPVPAHGSGISEFTALALRAAFIVTAHPPLKGPIVLDEPCPSVSDQYVSNVARFLKTTADSFGIQIIVMTHNQRMTGAADSVNVLIHVDGITSVQHRGGSIRAKSRPRWQRS